MRPEDKPRAGTISFFSGIGMLDLGFERAGFRTWMANEVQKSFCCAFEYGRDAMRREWGSRFGAPVRGVYGVDFESFFDSGWQQLGLMSAMAQAREETGLVGFVGGPPCPDFSVAGRLAGEAGVNGRLTRRYTELICHMQPDFFILENVRGLWSVGRNRQFYQDLKSRLEAAGYRIADRLLNTLSYWVPQDRWRVIMVGLRERSFPRGAAKRAAARFGWDSYQCQFDPLAAPWPGTEEFSEGSRRAMPPGLPKELTVEAWFRRNKVNEHENGGRFFQPRTAARRFSQIPEGDTAGKSFKRLHRWRYSPTAAYGNNEVHLHPYLPRRISVAEAMAIQTFPRAFALPNSMSLSDQFKTVGNAVPFRFARLMACTLGDALEAAAAG